MIISLHNCSTVWTCELESFTIFTKVLIDLFFGTELFLEHLVNIWSSCFMSLYYFLLLSFICGPLFCVYMSICSRILGHFLDSIFLIFFQIRLFLFPFFKVFNSLVSFFLVLELTPEYSAAWFTSTRFNFYFGSTFMLAFILTFFTWFLGVFFSTVMFHFAIFTYTVRTWLTVSILIGSFILLLSLRI